MTSTLCLRAEKLTEITGCLNENPLMGLCFKKGFIAQRVYTMCTRINYRIFTLTNSNKYLQYGKRWTEEYIYIYIYIYI
jgi:hypothetical protein